MKDRQDLKISFNTANFAFRQVGYKATGDWGQACRTSREHYSDVETFEKRFDEMLGEVDAFGFKAVELWHFHLHQKWWTDRHVEIALSVARRRGMKFVAYCGGFGDDLPEFERTLGLVNALGIDVLAGASKVFFEKRASFVERLRHHEVRFAYENHPEKTPAEHLQKIGGDEDVVGATVDTGWYGSQNYPADRALLELRSRLMHVHLKDVSEIGKHDTCGFEKGVVPIRACIETLRGFGFEGYVSVEHEPDQFDPTPDLHDARAFVNQVLEVTT
ncbi:sugar phosphate isomerase/epimerase family protein [Deinococcus yavapaiensis]|uniref:Sugar phosphate isomerase/epimerase n=1 Tax=Deinococcus yavapaiensis KR-236 TaxID=694435 RepID=A0A318S9D3_9DEIO|nr:sugar phosphate isomerase/epimerase [Deinococcus yavapaiensis]PYE54597.1 sugar phosphate isomerase/epimerase [Deinococcus yavapaiensis KR-236]